MKRLAFLLLIFGCGERSESGCHPTPPGSPRDFQAEGIFVIDGTTVYRFKDARESYYFAVGPKSATTASQCHTEDCGEGCTKTVCIKGVPTVVEKP